MIRACIHLSIYLLLICCALPLMAQSAVNADSIVPGMVKFTGTLNDVNGKPLTGTVGVTFLLYKEQSGGAPLWMETQNVQTDKNGGYSVMLGSSSSHGIPAHAFTAGEARWIGVQVSGQAEQPRVELGSVPYALKAADAQTLGGLPASAFLLAATPASSASAGTATSPTQATGTIPVTTAGGTAQTLAKFDAGADVTNSQVFDNGTNVGVGTNSPAAKLDVNGAAIFRGALTLPATGTATAASGKKGQPLNFTASAFNSSSSQAVNANFRLLAETARNNTPTASGKLNLLFGLGSAAPAETGLSISDKGVITFAPGQTFPGGGGSVTSVGLAAPASDFSVSGSPITSSGTLNLQWLVLPTDANVSNAIAKRDANGSFAANVITTNEVTANVLQGGLVQASVQVAAPSITGENANSGNIFGAPIVGDNIADGAVEGFGVTGVSDSANGSGVFGRTEGGGVGVFGTTNSASGQGVRGESFATQVSVNGFGPDGVDGLSHSSSGSGVEGLNDAGGTGVFASSDSGSGVLALSTSGTAVVAATNTGSAGEFFGNVDVEGTLSKSAGSFKIDHPLDPANKYLYHSFVESPDMMNIYNGTVITDAQGNAIVSMPDWFEALNRDFRYQLTVIGQFAQAIVASEIANHSFTIRTDKPNVKVSWQVTGIRHDAYANAHRIPVEELKLEKDRGLYLHPELYGAAAEKSISAARHPGAMRLVKESKIKLPDSTR